MTKRTYTLDQARTSRAFAEIAWPAIAARLGGGELLVVEDDPHPIMRALDIQAGIDAIQVLPSGQLRGLATRVQVIPEGSKPYDTFSVRLERDSGTETEYVKRLNAMRNNYLRPSLVVHGYIRSWDGPVLSVAAARMLDVWRMVHEGRFMKKRTTNATFAAVDWQKMQRLGYKVKIVRPDPLEDEHGSF